MSKVTAELRIPLTGINCIYLQFSQTTTNKMIPPPALAPEAIRRRKTTAAVIGGSLTGVAFAAVGIGLGYHYNRFGKLDDGVTTPKVLRSGTIVAAPSIAPSTSAIPSRIPTISAKPSMSVLAPTLSAPSNAPTEDPTYAPTSLEPTYSPTFLMPTEIPTEVASNEGSVTTSETPTVGISENPSLKVMTSNVPTKFPLAKVAFFVSDAPSTSSAPSMSEAPTTTNIPSVSPSISLNPSISPTTSLSPTEMDSTGTFRIRMHWQEGYMWQELPDEDWFCVACAKCIPEKDPLFGGLKNCDVFTHCEENMQLALIGCDPGKIGPLKLAQMATFKFIADSDDDELDGTQLMIHNTTSTTDLCIQAGDAISFPRKGHASLLLKPCDSTLGSQRFYGGRPTGTAFEFLPLSGNSAQCLSNHHHPRQEEQVYVQDCHLARKPKTSFWCAFHPENNKIGSCIIPTPAPTSRPTKAPTNPPTKRPTKYPTLPPTSRPTKTPTNPPTSRPTKYPITPRPTKLPTNPPTSRPTKEPITPRPTKEPITTRPTKEPITSRPTKLPTEKPIMKLVFN